MVRRSKRRGWYDKSLQLTWLAPFRCCQCMHRFVGFTSQRARRGFLTILLLTPLALGIWLGELDGSYRAHQQPCLTTPAENLSPANSFVAVR